MNFLQRFAKSWREAGTSTPVENATITTAASGVELSEFFGSIGPSSGYPVTEASALTVATVYRCCAIIGGAISQLPVHQFRVANDERESVKTPLWWLLNESPHPRWTASAWKEHIVRSVLMRGDSFATLDRYDSNGVPRVITPRHTSKTFISREGDRLKYAFVDDDGITRGYEQEDVLHFPGFGFDGIKSLSVLQWAAKQGIGNALAAADYAGKTFAEGAIPQIALKYPNKFSPAQAAALRESFVATYGGSQGGRRYPLVLGEGGDVKELSLTPEDAQLIETRKYERGDIATAFGVPPIMLGDNEKTTSWGTGVEQITIGFVRYTLKPHLVRWEEELNRKLFKRAGQFVEFEVNGLLRGDSKAQADYFKAALGGPGSGPGWMTPNQVRKLSNQPPEPGGDRLFYPESTNAQQTPSAP